ncbi:PepSY domain-containing protein [Pedobacter sp. SYP-B3415]|uniref:PepSY-associated TM helix domain-containing protein n=1 Tax=Pedobacter sp. SYP-B3415 TaxID=2496641 RepID=UPI00101C8654|nr:PepSY-associated TM helix domain-containing protein [Pedobacter sp. SYP-B3415]
MIWKRVKAAAAWLHLWVGLVTGIVVVIVSVTGCILVFEEELFNTFHRDLVRVKQTGPARPVSELLVIAKNKLGLKKPVTDIRINEADRSYIFSASKTNKKENIQWWNYFSQFRYRDDLYMNQYTGEVLGVIDVRYEFFNVVEQLHRQLLLIKPVGSVVIGSCILLFLLMMITGFILWLPKNLKQLKKSLAVKWGARWKRVNYDLHNSLGFYVLPIAMLIAITGLVWSFRWWEAGIYRIFGSPGKIELIRKAPATIDSDAINGNNTLDHVLARIQKEINYNYVTIGLNLPEKEEPTLMAFVYHKNRSDGWRNMSYFYFDMRTGKQFDQLMHSTKPLGLKWRNSNKDIHTGKIYGFGTQLLAFAASLVCASLPITGFLIWWGKRKKKSKKSSLKRSSSLNQNLVFEDEPPVLFHHQHER